MGGGCATPPNVPKLDASGVKDTAKTNKDWGMSCCILLEYSVFLHWHLSLWPSKNYFKKYFKNTKKKNNFLLLFFFLVLWKISVIYGIDTIMMLYGARDYSGYIKFIYVLLELKPAISHIVWI